MLAEFYPPDGIAGAHRPAKLAKYLPRFGWSPVVLCGDWTAKNCDGTYDPTLEGKDSCPTIRLPRPANPSSILGRIHRRIIRQFFSPQLYPRSFSRVLLRESMGLCERERFDALWATYSPGSTLAAASAIRQKMGIPWVADFRDILNFQGISRRRMAAFRRWEVRTCRNASAIVTVSDALAETLRKRHECPVYVLPNGFDPDDYPPSSADSIRPEAGFVLRYFGIIYPGRQNPWPVVKAINLLAQRGLGPQDIRVEFYGATAESLVGEMVGACLREGMVTWKQRVPQEEMVRLQQNAGALLVLSCPGERGILTSKVFGYLAAGRPILNVPGDGDALDALMSETGAGVNLAQPEAIAATLEDWVRRYRKGGPFALAFKEDKIARYSRVTQAQTLAGLLEAIVEKSPERNVPL
jgi:glycosyltransferase involved in cell wall biosynthesis